MTASELLGYSLGAFVVGLAAGLTIRAIVEFIAKAIDH
jgi:hypothetical protein